MNRLFHIAAAKFRGGLQRLPRRGVAGVRQAAHKEWLRVEGDRTLRVEYDLGPDSVVVDVGGYRGDWASDIYGRYGCRIHVLEPVPEFAEGLRRRFATDPPVSVHEIALGAHTTTASIAVDADASSLLRGSSNRISIQVVAVGSFLDELSVDRVDLMKINIEGAEYELVEAIVKSGWITRIHDLQIQFHDFVDRAADRLDRCQKLLSETHELTYSYPFVWENWRLRGRGPRPGSGSPLN